MSNSISGNAGVAGALVVLNGAAKATTTADGSGNYSFSGLAAGNYYVSCQVGIILPLPVTFTPRVQQLTIVSSNLTGINFTTSAAPAITQVWEKQGVVLSKGGTQGNLGVLEPTVIFEGNPQILSGNVFKMWFTAETSGGTEGIYYAESPDGAAWTQFNTSTAVIPGGYSACRIYKSGSTYYAFPSNTTTGNTTIDRWISSDGVNWTKTNSAVLSKGSSGAWDGNFIFNLEIFYDDGLGTWYAWYAANQISNSMSATGLVTSTDLGVTWTKFAGNPVMPNFESTKTLNIGGVWYVWANATLFNDTGATDPFSFPTDFYRTIAASNFQSMSVPTPSLFRTRSFEGAGLGNSQVNSPAILELNGKSYMWYDATDTGAANGTRFTIALATSNQPLSQIVKVNDGSDMPIQLASDNFHRGSLGANWTPNAIRAGMTIASNEAIPASTGATDGASYTGISWPNDHYSEVTAGPGWKAGSGANILTAYARIGGSSASPTYYVMFVQNNGAIFTEKCVAGTTTNISGGGLSVTVNDGDVFRIYAVGSVISIYQNGQWLASYTDSSIASGSAGMGANAAATATLCPIAAWAGGAPGFHVQGNVGVPGVTISWTGPTSGSVTSDASGNFNTNQMLPNGSYVITPSKAGVTFSPVSANETVNGANITGVNFAALSGVANSLMMLGVGS